MLVDHIFHFPYRRLIFSFPNIHSPPAESFLRSSLHFPFFPPNEAFYPSRPTVSATPDFLDISINFPGKGLLFYGRILECSYSERKSALKNEQEGGGRKKEQKGEKKKERNNDSRRLIFVSFACYTRTLPFESFRVLLYPRSHHFPSLRTFLR